MMTFENVKIMFPIKNFPFGNNYKTEFFCVIDVKTDLLEPVYHSEEIVNKYIKIIKENKQINPILCSVGRKMRDGRIQLFWDKRVVINDGNHRSQAYKIENKKTIPAIMPESHSKVYNKIYGVQHENN